MKKIKILLTTFLSSAPMILIAAGCTTTPVTDKPTDSEQKFDKKLKLIDLNKLSNEKFSERKKAEVNNLIELAKKTNNMNQKYFKLSKEGFVNQDEKLVKAMNIILKNNDSIVNVVNEILNKINTDKNQKSTAEKNKEKLAEIDKTFKVILFDKLEDVIADIDDVVKEIESQNREKLEQSTLNILEYVRAFLNSESSINGTQSNVFLDQAINSLYKNVNDIYFDEENNEDQKEESLDEILEEDLNPESDDHKTNEESHNHSHSLGNLIYSAYQSMKLLNEKVNIEELINKLKNIDETLDSEHKITSEISKLKKLLDDFKNIFSDEIVTSEKEIFKTLENEVLKIKQKAEEIANNNTAISIKKTSHDHNHNHDHNHDHKN
ncbi:hypothetical protein [Mycoplasmopsis cricetuli]|uniref:hypothetical protein n=1 Tax=Mycoplasmopsis cricetuli TaxID=171283 RepID=UPI0004702DFD|nr:hypothetical protein [Mycoplasmopsis cricetuli]